MLAESTLLALLFDFFLLVTEAACKKLTQIHEAFAVNDHRGLGQMASECRRSYRA